MIRLRTFNLQKIQEIEHYTLISSLGRDKGVTTYIARDFPTWIKKQRSLSDDEIEPYKSYVVERDGKYIGFVGSLDFTNDGIMEIWYAINKNLRGRGYGEKVLAEITPYLIEHVDGLKDIELNIDKSNKGSIKVAERNGYVFDHEEDGYMTYYYFGPNYDRGSRKR